MLSRAAALSRVCLTCRLSLTQRSATLVAYNSSHRSDRPRQYASDSAAQSKARIEALISGSLDNGNHGAADGQRNRRRGSRGGSRRGRKGKRSDDEPADWELPPKEERKPSAQVASDIPVLPEVVESNPETSVAASESEPRTDETAAAESSRAFRHDLLRHQYLGVEALGKPVEALIIKNPNKMKSARKAVPLLEEEAVAAGVPLHWEDVLPKEEEPEFDFSEEVRKNIDELRPSDTTVVRRKDFEKLVNALVDGFTREQLVGYFNRGDWEHTLRANNTPSYPWMVKQVTWQAAQSNQWGSLKQKQQQAVLILTAMWNLEIQEQVEGLGRMLIWVQPDIFRLIARPSSRVIESLSADYLDKSNNERISPKLEESRLAIYARKSTIATILTRIDEIVRSITSKNVSVEHVQGDNLLEPVLEELGRITNTTIQYNKEDSELSISWLADKDRPETSASGTGEAPSGGQTEDPADIALRLLAGHETNPQSNEAQIIGSSKNAKSRKGLFVEHHREKRAMSWRNKLRQWSRYVNPVTKEVHAEDKPLGLSGKVSLPKPTLEATDSRPTNRITATFGHILHTGHDTREAKMAKSRRILSPVVPHPASLTSIAADSDNTIAQSTAIILNFSPDPTQARKSGDPVPEIRLRLPVNPDTDLSTFAFPPDSTLEGVIPWHVNDILLPDKSVDVRLTQQHQLPLDANQQSLKEFLAVSEFNLLAGRLRTPSRTHFSIPSKWLSANPSRPTQGQATDVPYTFMGLEIYQVIDLEWHGHTLRYSSIEAGQHGGQRQELSLHAGPPGTHQQDMTEESAGSFLQLVEEVAAGKHFSWDEGYKFMQDRSDEAFTWDMMDESFDGEVLAQDPSAEEAWTAGDVEGASSEEQMNEMQPGASEESKALDTAAVEDAGEPQPSVSGVRDHAGSPNEQNSSLSTETRKDDKASQKP
ncbi:hypothetical protein TOPH_07280 [Tolypocladium ophioglossoides CBS 100239]|uniref:Uncharacterized protein n=1 Tax=Tolypocladium ophioglossoides (strain CBS 100239) TaxID=1163406 RepID=A0A0L0N1Z9_TOLOC|nr:hypothetical protein TOPH_07280 [Tolypocladium ophioglossoides CBS 100239]